MSSKNKFFTGLALSAAVLGFSIGAAAQDTTAPAKDPAKQEKHGRKMFGKGGHHGMRGGFGLRGIELTDAQKEQIRQIREANKPSEAEMQEMRSIMETRRSGGTLTEDQKARAQAFREQRRTKMEAVHAQVLAILTPEQRQQLEARKAERQNRMKEFREKRKTKTETTN